MGCFHFGTVINSIALSILYSHLICILELMYIFLSDMYPVIQKCRVGFSLPFVRAGSLGKEGYHLQCVT